MTTNTAYAVPSSFFTVAIAATQGVYNRENTKNTNAVNFVNKVGSKSVSPPIKTVNVLTTFSFAIKPVKKAVEILQSQIPSGLKIGTIKFPSIASKLSAEFVTIFNFASNVCKNQMMIVATKMTVNAFVIKSLAFV